MPIQREDLAALLARSARRIAAAERPLLARHSLSMWGYVVLCELDGGPAPTQLALAGAIGHDKTRLIGVLDDLEDDGLLRRRADPADRRARIVELTDAGIERLRAARAEIRALEAEELAGLTGRERTALFAALERLAGPDPAGPPHDGAGPA